MTAPLLQLWTAPKCQVGARYLGGLVTIAGQFADALEGTAGGRFTLESTHARELGVDIGQVVRAMVPRYGVRELVITDVDDGAPRATVDVTLGPIRQLFALRGYCRRLTDRAVALDFDAFTGTAAEYLARLFFTNLASDRLEWVSLGTIEDTTRRTWPALKVQTRGQVLTQVERLTGFECVVRALANDAGYAVDLVAQQNATRAPWVLDTGRADVSVQRKRALSETATVALGIGEDDAPMGEVAWVGGAPIGAGPFWVPLTDPTGGPAPIREDGQLVGTLLALPDGSTLAVTATRQVDSAVRVDTLGTYTTGQRVVFWENSTGRPVSQLTSPSALAQSRDLVVAKVAVRGGRQERNLVRNGAFESGTLDGWTDTGGAGGVLIPRAELGVTTTGRVTTARPAGTGTGIALAVKDFPPGYWFRRGHQLAIAGVTLNVSGAAIPDTSGALTLPIASPGLPASYPHGTPFQLVRRETRTLTLDGDQNALAPALQFRDSNTDGVVTTGAFVGGELVAQSGGFRAGFLGTAALVVPSYVDAPLLAGKLRVGVTAGVGEPLTDWPTRASDLYQFLGFTIVSPGATSTVVTYTGTTGALPAVGSVVQYFSQNGQWFYLRVTATAAGSFTAVPAVPGSVIPQWNGLTPPVGCNVTLADGSLWTFTQAREPRTLLLNGNQAAGALSLPFQAQANLATRNWQSGDWITMNRTVAPVFVVTAHSAADAYTDLDENGDPLLDENGDPYQRFVGTAHTLTLNLGASTIDEVIAAGDLPGVGIVVTFGAVSLSITPGSLSGATLSGFSPGVSLPSGSIAPGTYSATYTVTDTYAVGAASWASTGRAVLPLSAAIPAGRVYPRGTPVGANWVNGCIRLHAQASGGATTVDVFGHDLFTPTTDPASASRGAVYRIFPSGSTLPIPGEVLDCAADVQVAAGGTAAVTLRAANTTAVAVDAVLSVVVPQLLADTDPRAGAVLRLLWAPASGTPATGVPAYQSTAELVRVPSGQERVVTVRAWFGITPEALGPGQAPVAAIVDADTNVPLVWANIGSTTVTYNASPTELPLVAQITINTTRRLAVRVYGGSSSTFTRWHALKACMLYVGDSPDAPYTREALSLNTWHRCQDVLALRSAAARYSVRALDVGALTNTGTPPQLGQPALIRVPELGVTVRQRIARLVWRWPGAELVEVDVGPLAPKLTDVDVSL